MKKINLLSGFLSILSLLNATNVIAEENKSGAVTATLGSAYYHFSSRRHIDHTSMPNIALAYNATDRWAAEFFFGNANSSYHNGGNVHAMLYMLDGIYRFMPRDNFQSYIIGGVGIMDLKPVPTTDNQFQNNLNIGIGAQYFIHKMIAFRGEARDLYTTNGGKNDVMVGLGVSLLFWNT